MTKYEVLAILKNTQGYVSGEKISSLLGVSRAAVNAAVKALRKEGYEVSFGDFMKIGVPFTLTAVCVGYLFIWIVYA